MLRDLEGTKQSRQKAFNYWELRADTNSARVLELPVSSELPVDRGWGMEVLDHSPDAIDLTRLNDGAMVLKNHNPNEDIGVIEKAWIKTRKLYVRVKFDTHELAERMFQSVKNGIFRNVSIGYEIQEVSVGSRDGYPVYTAIRWLPLEISFVTVPADPTVGVGRAYNPKSQTTETGEGKMVTVNDVRSIYALADQQKLGHAWANECIEEGLNIQQARSRALEKLQARQSPIAAGIGMNEMLGLTAREKQGYSFCRALLSASDPRNKSPELEISDAIAQRIGKPTQGIYIPLGELPRSRAMSTRATYQAGTPTQGAEAVALDIGSLIEVLREQLVLGDMITYLQGLQGDLDLPKQTGQSTAYWVGESQNITRSESTFGTVSLRPHTVGCLSRYSQRMLLQASFDIEQFVIRDLTRNIAVEIDRAIINGSGAGNQPTGIMQTAGIGSVALGTNGGALTRAATLEMMSQVADSNAPLNECCYLLNSKTLAHGMGINLDAGSGEFLVKPMDGMPGTYAINGMPAKVTNLMPSNLTKGTGTNLSAMIFGRFSDIHLGMWSVLEVLPNPYGDGYASGDVEVRAMQTLDVGITRETSFSLASDIVTV